MLKFDHNLVTKGRLAQLVERNIDVVDATGSSPVPPTERISLKRPDFFSNKLVHPYLYIFKFRDNFRICN